MKRIGPLLISCCLLYFCSSTRKISSPADAAKLNDSAGIALADQSLKIPSKRKTDAFLEDLLSQYPEYFGDVLQKRDSLRVQIIYTQIDRQANNTPVFKNYYFNVDSSFYFYPASTVKMPVALLALQKLNELKKTGVDKYSTMITENDYSGQTPVYNDPTTPDGRPCIAHYVKKIFLVSDNDAFNRLYEFLGQQTINEQLRKMGYSDAEIIHRLDIFLSEDENRHTNPVKLLDLSGHTIYEQPMQVSGLASLQRNEFLGKGFIRNGQVIDQPFNFSRKNRIALEDLHSILKSVLFPQAVPATQRFNLSEDDYRFVWKYMSQYPAETNYPHYDSAAFWDAYGKFLYWGSEKGRLPKHVRIFNKIGDAYGFLVDVAYIVDFEKKIEFMLAATIHCNSDGIFNDDKYDYQTVGLPFMKHLGRILYERETIRKRINIPDLSTFKLNYEK